jgi:hypothetical protein
VKVLLAYDADPSLILVTKEDIQHSIFEAELVIGCSLVRPNLHS